MGANAATVHCVADHQIVQAGLGDEIEAVERRGRALELTEAGRIALDDRHRRVDGAERGAHDPHPHGRSAGVVIRGREQEVA